MNKKTNKLNCRRLSHNAQTSQAAHQITNSDPISLSAIHNYVCWLRNVGR